MTRFLPLLLSLLLSLLLPAPVAAQDDPAPEVVEALGADLVALVRGADEIVYTVLGPAGEGGQGRMLAGRPIREERPLTDEKRQLFGEVLLDETNFGGEAVGPGFEPRFAFRIAGGGRTATLVVSIDPARLRWLETGREVDLSTGGRLLEILDPAPGLPRRIGRALEAADRLVVYRVLPDWAEGAEAIGEYPIVAARELAGDARRPLVEALTDPATWGSDVASCFIPHHALRIVAGRATIDLVVCFECNYLVEVGGDLLLPFGDYGPLEEALEDALGSLVLDEALARRLVDWTEDGIDVPPVSRIDPAAARLLVGAGRERLSLAGIERLDVGSAEALAGFGGEELAIGSIGASEPGAVERLAAFGGALHLEEWTAIGPAMARELATRTGRTHVAEGALDDPAVALEVLRIRGLVVEEHPDREDGEPWQRALDRALGEARPDWVAANDRALDETRVEVADGMTLAELLDAISELSGVDCVLVSAADASLEIEGIESGTAREVLKALEESLDYRSRPGLGCVVVGSWLQDVPFDARRPPAADPTARDALAREVGPLRFAPAPMAEVIEFLAGVGGVPIATELDLEEYGESGDVHLVVGRRHSLARVLTLLTVQLGLDFRFVDGRIEIFDPEG